MRSKRTGILKLRGYEKRDFVGLLYIAPWLVGFAVFQFYPFLMSFYYSFTDFSMAKPPTFVGLKNYIHMFMEDADFPLSLRVTGIYVLIAVPFKLVFALLIAMVLNIKIKYVNFFRTVYYVPSILGGSVAVAVLWRFLFMKEGAVNNILGFLHIPAIDWLGSPTVALFTMSMLTVWQFGSSMVLFLAGLKQIPAELYEAGRVDGASRFRMFFFITVPVLTPIILFNVIMQIINAFQEFTAAFIITNGGPMKSTLLYGMKLYQDGFSYMKMGYASALSWVLFIIMMLVSLLIFMSARKWVHYEDGGDF